jgi:hypothetical protein
LSGSKSGEAVGVLSGQAIAFQLCLWPKRDANIVPVKVKGAALTDFKDFKMCPPPDGESYYAKRGTRSYHFLRARVRGSTPKPKLKLS